MTSPTYDFSGKVALGTGASGGMGRAIMAALGGAGATVMATDLTDRGDLPGAAAFTSADVSDSAQLAALVASTVERFGPLDYAVNAAAIDPVGNDADFDELLGAMQRMKRGRLYYNPLRHRAL